MKTTASIVSWCSELWDSMTFMERWREGAPNPTSPLRMNGLLHVQTSIVMRPTPQRLKPTSESGSHPDEHTVVSFLNTTLVILFPPLTRIMALSASTITHSNLKSLYSCSQWTTCLLDHHGSLTTFPSRDPLYRLFCSLFSNLIWKYISLHLNIPSAAVLCNFVLSANHL